MSGSSSTSPRSDASSSGTRPVRDPVNIDSLLLFGAKLISILGHCRPRSHRRPLLYLYRLLKHVVQRPQGRPHATLPIFLFKPRTPKLAPPKATLAQDPESPTYISLWKTSCGIMAIGKPEYSHQRVNGRPRRHPVVVLPRRTG